LTQRCVGEIDLAGCCTNTMRRQHDRIEFVHPSGGIGRHICDGATELDH
jgi:hypothetical protein